jgi:hypothetical protein
MFTIGYWIGYFICLLLPSSIQEGVTTSVRKRWEARPTPSTTTGFETGVLDAWYKPRLMRKV